MKLFFDTPLLLIILFLLVSCDDDDQNNENNCSTPTQINTTGYFTNPSEVQIAWGLAPKADGYLLEHYINDALFQDFETQNLTQRVGIDLNTPQNHRFNIYAKCGDDYLRSLNTHINVPTSVTESCPPPTNIQIVNITADEVTFSWDENSSVNNYTITDYSTDPPTTTTVDTNFITVPLNADNENNEFGFISNCGDGSSIEFLFCIATEVDINKMLQCDSNYYCQLSRMASSVFVASDNFRGSPQDAWRRYCPNGKQYPCIR